MSSLADQRREHAETVARLFHESYERLAPDFGYKTRSESAVPWEEVPEPNKSLMIAVADEVMETLRQKMITLIRATQDE
jgi:hypothetical protein